MKIKGLQVIALAGAAMLIWGSTARATTVDVKYEFPSQGDVFTDGGSQSIPASYSFFDHLTVDVGSSLITVDGITPPCVPCNYIAASFNGLEIDYTGFTVTSVALDPSNSLPGFSISDVSFTPSSIFLNLEGLNQTEGQIAAVDVNTVSATPLPSTWTMLIAGFVGLGFFAYRGSKKGTAALSAA